jgi:quinol monooxygenase YgiN
METTQAEERHIICVVHSTARTRERVQELLLELVTPARSEEGCLYYDLYQQTNELDTFYIVDGWASEAAVAAHTAHPNVSRVVEQLLPLLASPLVVTTNTRLSDRHQLPARR